MPDLSTFCAGTSHATAYSLYKCPFHLPQHRHDAEECPSQSSRRVECRAQRHELDFARVEFVETGEGSFWGGMWSSSEQIKSRVSSRTRRLQSLSASAIRSFTAGKFSGGAGSMAASSSNAVTELSGQLCRER